MGEAQDSQAEADDLGGGQEADRGGAESTVGEVQARCIRESGRSARGPPGRSDAFSANVEAVDGYLLVLDLPMLSVTDSAVCLGLHVHVPMVITH